MFLFISIARIRDSAEPILPGLWLFLLLLVATVVLFEDNKGAKRTCFWRILGKIEKVEKVGKVKRQGFRSTARLRVLRCGTVV